MGGKQVLVIRTGSANMASVVSSLKKVDAAVRVVRNPEEVYSASHVVLPGVGAIGHAMQQLLSSGMVEPLIQRLQARKPTLAICLGLHLLCAGSEEDPNTSGLGIIADSVTRFPPSVRVPQLGWNRVQPDADCSLMHSGHAFFANSYRLRNKPEGWAVAWADHGGSFVSALENGGILACQFHPELSGVWGLSLIRRWLDSCSRKGGA